MYPWRRAVLVALAVTAKAIILWRGARNAEQEYISCVITWPRLAPSANTTERRRRKNRTSHIASYATGKSSMESQFRLLNQTRKTSTLTPFAYWSITYGSWKMNKSSIPVETRKSWQTHVRFVDNLEDASRPIAVIGKSTGCALTCKVTPCI